MKEIIIIQTYISLNEKGTIDACFKMSFQFSYVILQNALHIETGILVNLHRNVRFTQ